MQSYYGPYEPTSPTVKPSEFVKVNIREKGYGENCERRTLEDKKNAKREKSECNETCSVARGPPGFLNGVLRFVCCNVGGHRTSELPQLLRWGNVVGSYEGRRKTCSDQGEETE
jgi:hypothetical protein